MRLERVVQLPRFVARIACGGIMLLSCSAAAAHEFWVQPSSFFVETGGVLQVTLLNGERFVGEPVPRSNVQIERFEAISGGKASDVRGIDQRTTSFVRTQRAGTTALVYQSREYRSVLGPDKFEAYLLEEGLEHIIEHRAALGEQDADGRETYVRCAKALIRSGDASQPLVDERAGLALEIIVQEEDHGDVIRRTAVVLYNGEPMAGLRVVAVAKEQPEHLIGLETDAEGRVALPKSASGVWMLSTIHMVRTDERDDCDWKSYWASSVFELR